MRRIWSLLAAVVMLAPTPSQAQDAHFERSGLYVASADLEASTTFYTRLFDREPVLRLPAFVAFDIAGGLYALVDRETYAADESPGGAVVPYLRVRDAQIEFERIGSLLPSAIIGDRVLVEGPLRIFKVRDPDGNTVEFYELVPPSP